VLEVALAIVCRGQSPGRAIPGRSSLVVKAGEVALTMSYGENKAAARITSAHSVGVEAMSELIPDSIEDSGSFFAPLLQRRGVNAS